MNHLLPPLPKSRPLHDAPESAEQTSHLPSVGALMVVAGGVLSGSEPRPAHHPGPLLQIERKEAS